MLKILVRKKPGDKDTQTQQTPHPSQTSHTAAVIVCNHSGCSCRGAGRGGGGGWKSSIRPHSKLWLTLNLQWPPVIYWGHATTQSRLGPRNETKTRERNTSVCRRERQRAQTEATLVERFSLIWITFTNERPQRRAVRATLWNWLLLKIKSRLTDIQFDVTCLETTQDAFSFLGIKCHYKYHNVARREPRHHVVIIFQDGVEVVYMFAARWSL